MRAGATTSSKPFAVEDLVDTVGRALDKRALTMENRRLKNELRYRASPDRIIGDTPAMQRPRLTIGQIADSGADVLVNGETGTGKGWWRVRCTRTAAGVSTILSL